MERNSDLSHFTSSVDWSCKRKKIRKIRECCCSIQKVYNVYCHRYWRPFSTYEGKYMKMQNNSRKRWKQTKLCELKKQKRGEPKTGTERLNISECFIPHFALLLHFTHFTAERELPTASTEHRTHLQHLTIRGIKSKWVCLVFWNDIYRAWTLDFYAIDAKLCSCPVWFKCLMSITYKNVYFSRWISF